MHLSFHSLRTGIMAHLAVLILAAMLLINLVMVKFSENDLLQTRVETGRLIILGLEKMITYGGKTWADIESNPNLKREIAQLLRMGGFSEASMVDAEGEIVFSTGSQIYGEKKSSSLSQKVLSKKKWSFDFYGSTWGVIWLSPERLKVSAPISFNKRFIGVLTVGTNLAPLYQIMRKSEKIVLTYIFLNTIILVIFGLYILSRTVIKPIRKLVNIADKFKEGSPFPHLTDSSQDEIGQLSRSLNMMLKRLEENKKELKTHISSLEKAYQEINKTRDEIIKSEKLASIGRLATGVAHEIGNPIGIALGYIELLKGENVDREEMQDFLERLESEITRSSQIIRQLLDFSRPAGDEQRQFSLHDLIKETVNMLTPQPMMAHIQIQQDLTAERDMVWSESNQLKQVFVNIIINAADAMACDANPSTLTIKSNNNEDSIEIRFTDTGPGVRQENLAHIFDPFYTTKEPGKGTGLGLWICYRIIETIGGTISVASPPGKGTTIIIHIPLYRPENEKNKVIHNV